MQSATDSSTPSLPPKARIHYRLLFPEPQTHHFVIDLEIHDVTGPVRLVMPSWIPGSYLIREFPRHVVTFGAADGSGRPLTSRKVDKNTWLVDASPDGRMMARYLVYAGELSVHTSHVDASHAFINGTSAFMCVEGRERESVSVSLQPPPGWKVTTALQELSPGVFGASSYDELVDSPLEIGAHQLVEFDVDGVPHRYAIWGRGNYDPARLVADTMRIVRTEKALFGELPYRAYTIILHLTSGGGGGLEHRNGSVLLADRWTFRGPTYESFLGLVAHELFHAWNGKRIRPEGFGPFNYARETYTRDLWIVEGITTYYTDLILRRSGLISPARYLEKQAEQITRLQGILGRLVQPLEDASFDAWIKFYRPNANSPNATVSYYQKGALVALLLDLEIRRATGNARSLDDVMRKLWLEHGQPDISFPPGRVEQLISEVAGKNFKSLFDACLRAPGEVDLSSQLTAVGLELVAPSPTAGPDAANGAVREVKVGFQFKFEGAKTIITNVMAGTAAWRAGINAGDELVALDGLRVDALTLGPRLQERPPGSAVAITLFRRDELLTVRLPVEFGPPVRLNIRMKTDASNEQKALLHHWLQECPGASVTSVG